MKTAERIFQLIKEKGIEQKQLAEYLGVQPQIITEWKTGRKKSYTKYINKIAEFFGVSTDYLLGNDEIKKRSMPEDMEHLYKIIQDNPEIKKYVEAYLSLKPEGKKQMDMFLDLLLRGHDLPKD